MAKELVESAAAWYLLGVVTGVVASFFFYIILNFKNDEIKSLQKELDIEREKRMVEEMKDRQMRSLELELKRANNEIKRLEIEKGL